MSINPARFSQGFLSQSSLFFELGVTQWIVCCSPPFPGRLAAVGIARRVGFRDWGLRRVWGHLIIPISIHFSVMRTTEPFLRYSGSKHPLLRLFEGEHHGSKQQGGLALHPFAR